MNECQRMGARLLGVKAPRLPAAYQEVAYLESTGTQYVNTGEVNVAGYEIRLDCHFDSLNYGFFGYYESDSDCLQAQFYNGVALVDFNGSLFYPSGTADLSGLLKYFDNAFYYNNEKLSGSVFSTYPNSLLFYLFAYHSASLGARTGEGKIYYAKLYDNANSLVRDFIPCYRKTDRKPGMYDLVNGVFYTNAGTGEFTVGGDVT